MESLKLPTPEPESKPDHPGIEFGKRVVWETNFYTPLGPQRTDPVAAKTTTRGPRSKNRLSQHKQDKNDLQQLDQATSMLESDNSDDESTATKRPLPQKESPAEPPPKKRRCNPRRKARASKKDFKKQF